MDLPQHASWTSELWIVVVVILAAVRQVRQQTRNINRFWIAPLVIVCLTGWLLFEEPGFNGLNVWLATAGFVVGVLLGVVRASTIQVRAADRPGSVIVKGSWVTLGIWGGLFALRFAARMMWGNGSAATAASGVLLAVLVGTVVARNAALYYKARRATAA